jgi:ribulose-5-phosphate 4-epimerase/fuculose-1-phosphate aldolase
MDEGYIKYHCNWIKSDVIHPEQIEEINKWRTLLFDEGYIGMYENGIGFGNISIRVDENLFLVSGSATGGIRHLTAAHYALVTDYNFALNQLTCKGMTMASSESLTHAAIYACSKETNAVIHVHHKEKWTSLLHKAATTNTSIPYGTPEMAYAIQDLISGKKIGENKIIAMGGHEEGLIAFGKKLEEAATTILAKP